MKKLQELKRHLKEGDVYRRADLTKWSSSVDRDLAALVKDGTLEKLSPGLYHVPKPTAFGDTPPEEKKLVRSFLKSDRFLLTSQNAYNNLGLGTTQLYNQRIVYNFKRHGDFKLGNRIFSFRRRYNFPKEMTEEFLLVDLLNNLDRLEEDKDAIIQNLSFRVPQMDTRRLARVVKEYGNLGTRKVFESLLLQYKNKIHGNRILT